MSAKKPWQAKLHDNTWLLTIPTFQGGSWILEQLNLRVMVTSKNLCVLPESTRMCNDLPVVNVVTRIVEPPNEPVITCSDMTGCSATGTCSWASSVVAGSSSLTSNIKRCCFFSLVSPRGLFVAPQTETLCSFICNFLDQKYTAGAWSCILSLRGNVLWRFGW